MSRPGSAIATAIAIVVGTCLGVVGSSRAASSDTLGQPPSPGAFGSPVMFAGTFADRRWSGEIGLFVSPDGRTLTSAWGIAPGECDDQDFGPTVPGRNGASGAEFGSLRDFAAPIRGDGSFSKAGLRTTRSRREPKISGTFSISGTFAGGVVRGRVQARSATDYDTCTANIAFTARRVSR